MLRFRLLVLAICIIANSVYAGTPIQFSLIPHSIDNDIVRIVVHNGKFEIFASGEIDPGATERFLNFVQKNSIDNATVIFDSPGGSLTEGIRLGKAIRSMRFDTAIGTYDPKGRLYKGMCASACAYAFVGGVYRFYFGGKEQLGIHQFYSSGDNQGDIGDIQLVSSRLIDYLQSMGVDSKVFVVASRARGDSMIWLSVADANFLGLSNNGTNPTTAEIKIFRAMAYLKLEQSRRDVLARVLLACKERKVTVNAGIVTTSELSIHKQSSLVRNYLETSSGELLSRSGSSGTSVSGSVLWIHREPESTELTKIIETDVLGIWTENGSNFRWGAVIDLQTVRVKIRDFAKNCMESAH
ncbi:MAG: hypothetical protein L3J00_07625 [Thiomicrorhabdus sp.]|nr:hypothetical protein [Thiomicrorhabdus sp.]